MATNFQESLSGRFDRKSSQYLILDVFTDQPLQGNQLAVFLDGSDLSDTQLQQTARELNLSETVFLLPAEQDGHARVRIFTPTVELPFAGHPVLGTAFVVGEQTAADVVRLEAKIGVVSIELQRENGQVVFGWMSQPIPSRTPYDRPAELLNALGVQHSGLPIEIYCNGPKHVYVELGSVDEVAALQPNLSALAALGEVGVNCFAGSGKQWKTRMFGPGLGVAEDPATGSAAGPLGVHLATHGRVDFGAEIEVAQGVEIGRPSTLHVRVDGSPDKIEQVRVGGSAVFVARGEYRLA